MAEIAATSSSTESIQNPPEDEIESEYQKMFYIMNDYKKATERKSYLENCLKTANERHRELFGSSESGMRIMRNTDEESIESKMRKAYGQNIIDWRLATKSSLVETNEDIKKFSKQRADLLKRIREMQKKRGKLVAGEQNKSMANEHSRNGLFL